MLHPTLRSRCPHPLFSLLHFSGNDNWWLANIANTSIRHWGDTQNDEKHKTNCQKWSNWLKDEKVLWSLSLEANVTVESTESEEARSLKLTNVTLHCSSREWVYVIKMFEVICCMGMSSNDEESCPHKLHLHWLTLWLFCDITLKWLRGENLEYYGGLGRKVFL